MLSLVVMCATRYTVTSLTAFKDSITSDTLLVLILILISIIYPEAALVLVLHD